MRSFSCGKLETRKLNYKHYATNHAFAPYSDVYLKALTQGISTNRSWLSRMIARIFKRTEMLNTSTMLHVLSTLWVREHNRLCDELSQKWPSWTNEELYTKARNIVTGQMINIMMTEILNLELRPEMYDRKMENIRDSGKPIELYFMMAVSNLPQKFQYSSMNLTSYSNTSQVSEAGLKDALQLMMSSKMRMATAHDDGSLTGQLTKTLMTLSREQCLQGFNSYRRRLGLPAYNSFFDLTGNVETAIELEKLYSTVEKVELLTGVLTEKSSSGVLPTAKILSNSFIVNAILTNSLTSKHMWAPDTFGGVEFFDLVKSSSLESLVCRNVDNCDELKVGRYAK
ncbi:prostaglandin G/H synthase 1-like [Metopolophium dirhodum]|uniref:prostaglandin G/H synthase 1-like n=1 Tax=Metopolophium dirhodum TaxID=44670 RepID=UPI00299028F3|nr:prostaglandin G/H synthase 1-like [Metopolophium dirhodum]XP_060871393.1 prostaglandin G/H synthase 1-like [Metopolophium dirhodum]